MNINILRYSLFGIAGGQEVDLNFYQIYNLPSYNDWIINSRIYVAANCLLYLKLVKNYTAYVIKTTCCFRLKLKPMFLTSLKIL